MKELSFTISLEGSNDFRVGNKLTMATPIEENYIRKVFEGLGQSLANEVVKEFSRAQIISEGE